MRVIELILYKAYADLRVESSRGKLGMLWWILEPVLYMSALYVVFTEIRSRGHGFVPFLLVGLVVWKWFATTITQGSNSIVGGSALFRQVNIPKYVFPSVTILTNIFKFLIIFILLLLFLSFYGGHISWQWLTIPILLIIQLLVIASLTFLLAAIVPFFPDIKMLIENALMLLFFLSGILFDISHVSAKLKPYFYLNPMVSIVAGYRDVLLKGIAPNWSILSLVTLASLVVWIVAYYILWRYDKIYPKLLIR